MFLHFLKQCVTYYWNVWYIFWKLLENTRKKWNNQKWYFTILDKNTQKQILCLVKLQKILNYIFLLITNSQSPNLEFWIFLVGPKIVLKKKQKQQNLSFKQSEKFGIWDWSKNWTFINSSFFLKLVQCQPRLNCEIWPIVVEVVHFNHT